MNIIELLKKQYNARLSLDNCWLVWDTVWETGGQEWVIYRQKYGERVKLVARATTEEAAVLALMEAAGVEDDEAEK